jgi:hypothetical protein
MVLLGVSALCGCADPYRNLYEGLQKREGIVNPAAKPAESNVPYDQYKSEREKLRDTHPEK